MNHLEIEILASSGSYQLTLNQAWDQASFSHLQTCPFVVLIDQTVEQLFSSDLDPILKTAKLKISFPSLEANKSWQELERLLSLLVEHEIRRTDKLLVIGGGICGDIGGLAAALFQRGIEWEYWPTTLLSQADSCIGGKTAVNFSHKKNFVGHIYPPRRVQIFSLFHKTLPQADWLSGCGEVLKSLILHGSVESKANAFIDFRENRRGAVDLIFAALSYKKSLIEQDEFDRGVRQYLNFGHSFGHAIETITDFKIPHGIAVAAGMGLASFVSLEELGFSTAAHERLLSLSRPIYADYLAKIRALSPKELLNEMGSDKKNTDRCLKLILLREFGRCEIVSLKRSDHLIDCIARAQEAL